MIKASTFALRQNHSLQAQFDLLKPQTNHPKKLLQFLKGDPTFYDNDECKMTEEGYQIMKESIDQPENHSYCHAAGTEEARSAIAESYDHGRGLTADDVIITSGVNQGLLYALWSACDPGSNILVPEIGYPFFEGMADAYGVELKKYKLKPELNWEIDLDDVLNQLDDNTSFIYIINPSNPCGSVYSKQHIQDIIKLALDNCLLIVADESYYGMSFNDFYSFGELAEEGPIICLGGLDKAFFVPGWATAWVIFYDKAKYAEDIRLAFLSIIQLLLHSNVFIMGALPGILHKLTPNFAKQACGLFLENRDYLIDNIDKIRGLKCIPSQGTYYMPVFIDLKEFNFQDDEEFCQSFLKAENVILLPLSWNGSDKYQGFRMLTNATKDIYDQFLQRLRCFAQDNYYKK